METQYFTYAKGTNGHSVDICYYCCYSPDDLLTVDEMKKVFDCGCQQPLRLCAPCAELEIKTSFVEKKKQHKATKRGGQRRFRQLVERRQRLSLIHI